MSRDGYKNLDKLYTAPIPALNTAIHAGVARDEVLGGIRTSAWDAVNAKDPVSPEDCRQIKRVCELIDLMGDTLGPVGIDILYRLLVEYNQETMLALRSMASDSPVEVHSSDHTDLFFVGV